jgi:hypothetical protein
MKKIPLEIQRIKDRDGVYLYRAIISLEDAIKQAFPDKQLIEIQNGYNWFIGD